MSTSLLYHAWNLKDYRYLRTEYSEGAIVFHVERKAKRRFCSSCKSSDVVLDGRRERRWKAAPIGGRTVRLAVHLHRQSCRNCGVRRLEPLTFADPKKSFTRQLARHVLALCRRSTIADVAFEVGLPWDAVCDIVRSDLEARKKRIDVRGLTHIAIDEVSVGKGQTNYLTVVLDLWSGRAVYVVEGRGKAGLTAFFKRLRRLRVRLRAVAMDMHEPFRLAVREHLGPRVAIVFDHFHVAKLFNEQLDEVRRDEVRQVVGAEGRRLIKGCRYLLLKGAEKLKPDGKQRLDALLAVNAKLSTAYILKEALRECWKSNGRAQAKREFNDWIAQAKASGIPRVAKFADTLIKHMDGILNYFTHPISTGPLEAFNNKIGVLKRRAYGFRNRKFLMLRVLFLHECRRDLIGS